MKTEVIKTNGQLKIWLKSLSEIFSFDTETTSLDYLEIGCEGFSICDGERACYVPIILTGPEVFNIFKDFVDKKRPTIIMHNAVFDMKVLKKCFNIEDHYSPVCTLVASYLTDENRSSHSLKELAKTILGVPKELVKKYDKASDCGTDTDKFFEYAINDAIWTWKLWNIFEKDLRKQKLDYVFFNIEMPFTFSLVDLETNGIHVDQKELEKLNIEASAKKLELEKSLLEKLDEHHYIQKTLFGDDEYVSPINFGSSKQLIPIIQERFGLEITERTKPSKKHPKGQLSVGNATMKKLSGHPFVDNLQRYKDYSKIINSFTDTLSDHIDNDGRVRPSYRLIRTGRLSCSNPNLQQLPREGSEVNFRNVFCATEGNTLVKADFGGQELCLLAEVSQDDTLVISLRRFDDLHLKTANSIFELGLKPKQLNKHQKGYKKIKQKYGKERHKAKNGANFPTIYGTTIYGISKRQGVSKEEAQKWLDCFFNLYPGVKDAIEKTKKELYKQCSSSTLFGRKRRWANYRYLVDSYDRARRWDVKRKLQFQIDAIIRQAFNHKIQGMGADCIKIAANKMREKLYRFNAKLVLTVHDELVYEVPKNCAEQFAKVLKHTMENCISISVPLEVDVSIKDRYGE